MAEYLVEDYFAGSGGAADDSTDCTAAIQAALDDIAADGKNGTLVFPSGVCRMTGSVSKNLSFGGSQQGMFVMKGTGDSAVRFMGASGVRIQISGLHNLLCEKMAFLGDLSGDGTVKESNTTHIHFQADIVTVRDSLFLGLGCSAAGTGALLRMQGLNHNVMDGCQFRGTNGGLNPNVIAGEGFFNRFSNIICIDYGVYNATSYSKGGGGCSHWIKLDNGSTPSQRSDRGTALIEDCFWDEGSQTSPIHCANLRSVEIRRCGANVAGAGKGPTISDVKNVRVADSFFGYTAIDDKVGVSLTNVEYAEIDGVKFFMGNDDDPGVDRIEMLGTPGKVIIDNFAHGNLDDTGTPLVLVNTAGSEVIVDGVSDKGTITQIG